MKNRTLPIPILLLALVSCDEVTPAGPQALHQQMLEVHDQTPRTRLPVGEILHGLYSDRESNGLLLVGLKERGAVRGIPTTSDGGSLSLTARLEASERVQADLPQLRVVRGVVRAVPVQGPFGPEVHHIERHYITVRAPDSSTVMSLLEHPNVDFVEPNWRGASSFEEHDRPTLTTTSAGFQAPPNHGEEGWHIDAMRARSAWGAGYNGEGVGTGIVDTGFDHNPQTGRDHPDLEGFGAYFGNFTTDQFENDCTDWTYICYWEDPAHGSGVLGAMVALEQDDYGAMGIAPGRETTRLIDYVAKAAFYDDSADELVVYEEDFADAVTWISDSWDSQACNWGVCLYSNTRVAVTSLGWQTTEEWRYQILEGAFFEAYSDNKVLWFAAAGRGTGDVQIPGSFHSTVAVGYVDYQLNRATLSPGGPNLDLVAPGVAVPVTMHRHVDQSFDGREIRSGSSFAAGFAAGAARLAFQKCAYTRAWSMFTRMINRSRDLGTAGYDYDFGHGFVDAYDLVTGAC